MKNLLFLFSLIILLFFPVKAYATSQSDFPSAAQGAINLMYQNSQDDFQVNVTLPGYYLDCWNDIGFTETIYNATTNQPVATMINSYSRHLCGYLDNFNRSYNWTVFPNTNLPSGTYWVYAHSNNNGNGTWVTGNFSYTALTPPNQAPTVTFTASTTTINEGDTFTGIGSFTDPDSTSWTATVDYDDGAGPENLPLNPDKTFSLNHQYQTAGTYTVTVSITDNQGAIGTQTTSVTVNNVTPTVGTVTLSPNPVQINTSITATATYTDPGTLDTHTATANWGDGNTNAVCLVNQTTNIATCTHPNGGYVAANVYPVTITVSDESSSGTSPESYASVYNPTQGSIFSAGQRFNNPGTATPSTNGNVIFGLNYKYQGGMPEGVRQFSMDFNTANIHFNATSVTSLVISGTRATLKGSGTLNDTDTYNFLVVGENGNGIRIKITDPANNNAVIYDSQNGASDTATPATPVTGQVIVH